MLKVSEVVFSYGKNRILDGISFEIADGECVALTGENGCGKSTLLSVIGGVLKPSAGGIDAQGARIGLVPQGNSVFFDMTVLQNLRFFYQLAGKELARPLPFGLEEYASQKASRLSGGYKKRLNICCTLAADPDILLFDEPCANLDGQTCREIIEMIAELKRLGKSILYVGHDSREYEEICDRILTMRAGKLK